MGYNMEFVNNHSLNSRNWTTYTELGFITGLGTYSENHFDRIDLLQKYINAPRSHWGDVDKNKAIAHAYELLATLTAKIGDKNL